MTENFGGAVGERPALVLGLRIVAALVALLVLIQAVFAGRGVFLDADALDIHGMIGNATFLLVVAQVVLVVYAKLRGNSSTLLLGATALLLVLVIAQLGLGYGGRDNTTAAAWHIPNGVLIFGLTTAILALIFRTNALEGS